MSDFTKMVYTPNEELRHQVLSIPSERLREFVIKFLSHLKNYRAPNIIHGEFIDAASGMVFKIKCHHGSRKILVRFSELASAVMVAVLGSDSQSLDFHCSSEWTYDEGEKKNFWTFSNDGTGDNIEDAAHIVLEGFEWLNEA